MNCRLLAGVASDSRASQGWAGAGGPVPARGPAGAAAMGAAARVTSRGGDTRKMGPSAAVRDVGRESGRRGPAAESGGDIDRREQVAVADVPTGAARELAAIGLGHAAGAGGARGGSATFVDQLQADPSRLSLVFEDGDQVADPPVPGALIVPPTRLDAEHAAGIAVGQGAHP